MDIHVKLSMYQFITDGQFLFYTLIFKTQDPLSIEK